MLLKEENDKDLKLSQLLKTSMNIVTLQLI